MVRIGSIVLRVDDLRREAEFWAAALDYVAREEPDDSSQMLMPRDGMGPNLNP
jgi:catechol-2,3-dioxygenase